MGVMACDECGSCLADNTIETGEREYIRLCDKCYNNRDLEISITVGELIYLSTRQEPEAVEPLRTALLHMCGSCEFSIATVWDYCPRCGKKINWKEGKE